MKEFENSSFYTKIHYCKKFEEKISSIFQKIWNSLGVFHILRKHHEGGQFSNKHARLYLFKYRESSQTFDPLFMAFIFSDNFVLLHAVKLLNETVIESNYQTLLEHSVLKTAKIIQAKGIDIYLRLPTNQGIY